MLALTMTVALRVHVPPECRSYAAQPSGECDSPWQRRLALSLFGGRSALLSRDGTGRLMFPETESRVDRGAYSPATIGRMGSSAHLLGQLPMACRNAGTNASISAMILRGVGPEGR